MLQSPVGSRRWISGVFFGGAKMRPYSSTWRGFLSVGMCINQLAAAVCSLIGVYYSNASALQVASTLGVVCFYMLFLEAIVELWPKYRTILKLMNIVREMCSPQEYYGGDVL